MYEIKCIYKISRRSSRRSRWRRPLRWRRRQSRWRGTGKRRRKFVYILQYLFCLSREVTV